MCKRRGEGIQSSPASKTAAKGVLPKGGPPLVSESEVGQLRLLEKCLSIDKDRGSVCCKFRLGIHLMWAMLDEPSPILSSEKHCQGSELIFS